MAVRKIVYVTPLTFSDRDFKRYGIPFMLDRGIEVTILDVADFVIPAAPRNRDAYPNYGRAKIRVVPTKKEFAKQREILSGADIIVDLLTAQTVSRQNLPVLREISRSGTPSLVISANIFPGSDVGDAGDRTIWVRIIHLSEKLARADLLNSLIARLPRQVFGIKAADFVVYGGARSLRPISLVDQSTRPIFAHSMDYDVYLQMKDSPPEILEIAVFLDQGIVGHREFLDPSKKGRLNADRYFEELRSVFDVVERQTGLDVVIACHPHTMNKYDAGEFGDRKLVKGKSIELVAASKLVIAHHSTLIGMAVTFDKPLLLIFSREHMYRRVGNIALHRDIASALAKKIHFLGDIETLDITATIKVDRSVYKKYMCDYIKTDGSRDQPFWQIVMDEVSGHDPAVAPAETGARSLRA